MFSLIRTAAPTVLFVSCLSLLACAQGAMEAEPSAKSGDEEATGSEVSTFEAPVVVLLEDEPCFDSLEFIGADRSQINFHFSCAVDEIDLEVGDVVAGVIGGGYLGRVGSIERGADSLVVFTEYIPLNEAVEEGEFDLTLQGTGARALIDLSGKTLYRETHGGLHIESGFRSGYLTVRPETQLGAKMQWGRLDRFDAVVGMRVDANFDYYVAASGAHRIDEEYPISDFEVPFYVDVSGVPLVGTVKYEVFVRFVSETTGYLDMTVGSYQGHWGWEVGGRYRSESGWQDVWDTNQSSELSGLEMVGDTGWRGRIEFSMRPTISFYETVSVAGRAAGHLRGRADPECEGLAWSFTDGIRAAMTLSVRWVDRFIPDMPLTVPMGTSQWDIDSGTIPWPGDLPAELIPACGGELPWDQSPPLQPASISCGELVSGDTSDSEQATELLSGYSCSIGSYHAPEVVYAFTAATSGQVTFRLVDATPMETNHDLFALDGDVSSNSVLLGNSCVATGMNSMVFEAVAGQTYLLVVDGYATDSGSFQALLEC